MKQLAFFFLAISLSFNLAAAEFKEGENYRILPLKKADKPTVTEFFSFYCPHCNAFEPVIQQLKAALGQKAKLEKSHVSFIGGAMGPEMSKAYATMIALGVESKMVPVMFQQIHDRKDAPQDPAALRQLFIDNGVDGKKFDAAYNGFAVESMVQRFEKRFDETGFRGVPSVIVNNKYVVETKGIKSMGEYIELVNFLLTLK